MNLFSSEEHAGMQTMITRLLLTAMSSFLLILQSMESLCQDGAIDQTFKPELSILGAGGADNIVKPIAIQPDGKILIGGSFTIYNGSVRNNLARLNADGSLDLTFKPGSGPNGAVWGITIYGNGQIIIAGSFTSYNGISKNRIARLFPDGTLDETFNITTGVNGDIFHMEVESDGIMISGAFTKYDGIDRQGIARLKNIDGSLNSSFIAKLDGTEEIKHFKRLLYTGQYLVSTITSGSRLSKLVLLNSNGTVANNFGSMLFKSGESIEAIEIQSNGSILLGGIFYPNGSTRVNGIMRIKQSGEVDPTFRGDVNGGVYTMKRQTNGSIIIGGNFTSYNGVPRSKVIRLYSDGEWDFSFYPGIGIGQPNVGTVRCLEIQTDGKILASGNFNTHDNLPRSNITRMNSGGNFDESFNGMYQKGANGFISSVLTQPDGKILVGGLFSRFNEGARNNMARLSSSGILDYSFNTELGTNGAINAMALQSDGKIVVGGSFSTFNEFSRKGIARTLKDGRLDETFKPGTGANGAIYDLDILTDGRIYISGDFNTYNGNSRNHIARLLTDGNIDASFNTGSGPDGSVICMAMQADGKILIGGVFRNFNGVARSHIARLHADGSLDLSFNPGMGANNVVYDIKVQPDGKILLSGVFTVFNGTPRNYLARLNADGKIDPTFNPEIGTNGPIKSMALQSDGKILAGGFFTNFAGVNRSHLVRINPNGSLDNMFDPGTGATGGPNSQVYHLTLQPDGKAFIVGDFAKYNNQEIYGIAKIISNANTCSNPGSGGSIAAAQSGFSPFDPVTLTNTASAAGYSGTLEYIWQQSFFSNSAGFSDIPGATSASYDPGPLTRTTWYRRLARVDCKADWTGAASSNVIEVTVIACVNPTSGGIIAANQNGMSPFDPAAFSSTSQASGHTGALQYKWQSSTNSNNNGFNDISGATAETFDPGPLTQTTWFRRLARVDCKTDWTNAATSNVLEVNIISCTNPTSGGTIAGSQCANGPFIPAAFTSTKGASGYNGNLQYQWQSITFGSTAGFINITGATNETYNAGQVNQTTWYRRLARVDCKTNWTEAAISNVLEVAVMDVKPKDGEPDLCFQTGYGPNVAIWPIALQTDGRILIGGNFTNYNGIDRNRIARLNTNGSMDESFITGSGANSGINSIALQTNGKILIGGNFTNYKGIARNRIARLNEDGSLDASFNPGTGVEATVNSIVIQTDGKILLGGIFTSLNGTGRNSIARMNADGSLDATFNPGTGANGSVNSIAVQPDGKILIVGNFTTFNGTGRNRIARLNANGSLDDSFNPGSGVEITTNSIALQKDGKILIGGSFTNYNGTPRNCVARLNPDGSIDASFNPGNGANGSVTAFGVQSDGKIMIGGTFTTFNGIVRNRIARLNPDGSLDPSFNPGSGADSQIRSLILQSDGKVLIGGLFTSFNGVDRNYVARIFSSVLPCVNPTSGGTIAANQGGTTPFDPVAFTSTTTPTGHSGGSLQYKWQSSTTGNTIGFNDIPGASSEIYDPGTLTQTNWFRRLARVDCKTDWTEAAVSNVIEVTVKVSSDDAFNVFPNPTSGNYISVKLKSQPKGSYELSLLNQASKVLCQKNVDHMGGTETYNLEWTNMIPAGLYVLRIIKDENEIIGTMTVFIE